MTFFFSLLPPQHFVQEEASLFIIIINLIIIIIIIINLIIIIIINLIVGASYNSPLWWHQEIFFSGLGQRKCRPTALSFITHFCKRKLGLSASISQRF